MKRILPVDELARDERFERIKIEDVIFDARNASAKEQRSRRGERRNRVDHADQFYWDRSRRHG